MVPDVGAKISTRNERMMVQVVRVGGLQSVARWVPVGIVRVCIFALVVFGLLAPLVGTTIQVAHAQPSGNVITDPGFVQPPNAGGQVRSIELLQNGKALIGGDFKYVSGKAHDGVVRLNIDGSIDPTFTHQPGEPIVPKDSAVQPDGKRLIVGDFTTVAGKPRSGIARLNQDGSVDDTFNPGSGFAGTGPTPCVESVQIMTDSRIVVAGCFTRYNGRDARHFVRLHANGNLDTSFTSGSGFSPSPTGRTKAQWKVLADGSLVVGGDFSSYRGQVANGILRLSPSGIIDTRFNPGAGFPLAPGLNAIYNSRGVHSVLVRPDGRVIVVGDFQEFDGHQRPRVVQLTNTGQLDAGYRPGSGPHCAIEGPICLAEHLRADLGPDGTVVLSGEFDHYDDLGVAHIVRLREDGSLDREFAQNANQSLTQKSGQNKVNSVVRDSSGRILVGGFRKPMFAPEIGHLVRLLPDGTRDQSYVAGEFTFTMGSGIWDFDGSGHVDAVAVQPDGKTVAVGEFLGYNGVGQRGIVRINRDGSVDTTFKAGEKWSRNMDGNLSDLALLPDGSMIVVGSIKEGGWYFPGHVPWSTRGILRLLPDGTVDRTFTPHGGGFDKTARGVLRQSDGKLLVWGDFTSFNGIPRRHVVRLHANGTLDTTFDASAALNKLGSSEVSAAAVQPNGKILVTLGRSDRNAGWSERWPGVIRLNADGSHDTTFSSGRGLLKAFEQIEVITVLRDGDVLLGGSFASYDSSARNNLVRVNGDGTVDRNFLPGGGSPEGGAVEDIAIQSDGRIVLVGSFNTVGGATRNGIARLRTDGSLDTSLDPGIGFTKYPTSLAMPADGVLVVGGNFSDFDDSDPAPIGVTRLLAPSGATPGAPAITTVQAKDKGARVAFSPPRYAGETAITAYSYSLDGGTTWSPPSAQAVSASAITVGGLVNGRTYGVTIRAHNAAGSGQASGSQTVTPDLAPRAPTIGAVTAEFDSLSIPVTSPPANGGSSIVAYDYSLDNGVTWVERIPVVNSQPLVVKGLPHSTSFSVKVRARNTMVGASSAAVRISTAKPAVTPFTPVAVPVRVADTRAGEPVVFPSQKVRLGARKVLEVPVAGKFGVPANAGAVSLNVTAVSPDGAGFLTVFPCGVARPNASNLNFTAGQVVANAVLTGVGAGGMACVYSSVGTDVIVDVNGWLPAGAGFTSLAPVRVADTRAGEPVVFPSQKVRLGARKVLEVPVAGKFGVPANAGAVSLNVTAVSPDGAGFLTVFPCGAQVPLASNVNYVAGRAVPNAVLSKVGAGGKVCVYSSQATDVIADLSGWFAADAGFYPLMPVRVADTRAGEPVVFPSQKVRLGARKVLEVPVAGKFGVPANAGAVSLNVTAVSPDGAGFLTVFPCGAQVPLASNVNYVAGRAVPNAVLSKIGAGGKVCVYSSQATDLVIDTSGWFPSP